MVQPRTRLWFPQAPGRVGRRGRVRAHGDGAPVSPARTPAGSVSGGADRAIDEGAYSSRASRGRRVGLATGALVALIACSPQAPAHNAPEESVDARAQAGLREVPLTIRSKNAVHRFTVEVAATADQQERGLMFRKELAGDRGMLFPYNPAQEVAFWMKNTLIALDIVFIRNNGTIARITNA